MNQMTGTKKNNEDKPKSGRGGARPGSGSKPLEPKIRRSVGLSQRQWAIFDERGGNEWLRDDLDAKPPATTESL
jgi:hypothetical protein